MDRISRTTASPGLEICCITLTRIISSLPKLHRDNLQSVYNAHMLHSTSADPFKLALYKLMGKLEPSRRSVPQVTTTTEDWLWFQLAMVMYSLYDPFTETDDND